MISQIPKWAWLRLISFASVGFFAGFIGLAVVGDSVGKAVGLGTVLAILFAGAYALALLTGIGLKDQADRL